MIYLDNAATTFPKPPDVLRDMVEIVQRSGVSPGRGSYDMATEAQRLVDETRAALARFFGTPDPQRVIFALNATDALNLAIQGLAQPGDHVVATRLEHNSVLRPLYHLRRQGVISYDLAPFNAAGTVEPEAVQAALKPNTRLVAISHVSNVLGTVQPIARIGKVCAERGVPLLVDCAQSAGVLPIDMEAMHISVLAFTGHKSLLGPTGIGGLAIQPGLEIRTTRFGGTGIDSRSLTHTQDMPHRLEAGTLNFMGIIGLSRGLDYVTQRGVGDIHEGEMALVRRLASGLGGLDNVEMYCAESFEERAAVLTINVKGMHPSDVGAILDGDFDIAVRTGLHCAPLVHETLGTFPEGAVRFSPGPFNSEDDIDRAVAAVTAISRSSAGR